MCIQNCKQTMIYVSKCYITIPNFKELHLVNQYGVRKNKHVDEHLTPFHQQSNDPFFTKGSINRYLFPCKPLINFICGIHFYICTLWKWKL
jgi:hypothetical protein